MKIPSLIRSWWGGGLLTSLALLATCLYPRILLHLADRFSLTQTLGLQLVSTPVSCCTRTDDIAPLEPRPTCNLSLPPYLVAPFLGSIFPASNPRLQLVSTPVSCCTTACNSGGLSTRKLATCLYPRILLHLARSSGMPKLTGTCNLSLPPYLVAPRRASLV